MANPRLDTDITVGILKYIIPNVQGQTGGTNGNSNAGAFSPSALNQKSQFSIIVVILLTILEVLIDIRQGTKNP